ncbi:MAG: hypothetical protein LBS20_16000 [Prevotella sp.]|jgi:hypothetical protein|nr:hypothetical protein [Prevotella sp.]
MHSSIFFTKISDKNIETLFCQLFDLKFSKMDIDTDTLNYYKVPIDYPLITKVLKDGGSSAIVMRMSDDITFGCFLKKNIIGCNEPKYDDNFFKYVFELDLTDLIYIARDFPEYNIFRSGTAIDIDYWKYKNIPIPEPMVYIHEFSFTDPNHKILSYEHIPSHAHFFTDSSSNELTFEACWQMYFGEIYYKYIPKPLFDAFTDCEENVILEHGIRRITLYKDPEDFGKPNATARQWAFRRQLGIDSIGHELTYNKNRIEPENLPVLITKKNCIKGQTKVTRFLDENYQLINSDKATYKEIKEYLDDGITVVFEEIVDL